MTPIVLPEAPCLLLDLAAFERNVKHMAQTIIGVGGKRWRPHVKAIRAPALVLRLISAGAQGITCATIGEAQAMVAAGIKDVLVASNVVTPEALNTLAELNRAAQVMVAVDAPEHLRLLAEAARRAHVTIGVVIEVDVGLARSGVPPGDAALELGRRIQAEPSLSLRGLMAWEGHATRISDAQAKAQAIRDCVGQLTQAAQRCVQAGLSIDIVSCGGTGTFETASTLPGVTELQAGGGVFGDRRYRTEFHLPLEQALVLRATVLSRPSARRVVCNAGWRCLGVYPTASKALHLPGAVHIAHAAEHLTLECDRDVVGFGVGERIDLEVGYADATVFLHHTIYGMRDGVLVEAFALPATPR